jgi:hypothetical protein
LAGEGRWPGPVAPRTIGKTYIALATLIPAVTTGAAPDGIDPRTLREALRHFVLAPASFYY